MSYTVQSGALIWLKVPTFGTNVCLAQEPWRFLTKRNVIKILFGELLIKKAAPGPSCDGPGAASRQRQRLGLFGASKRKRCSKRRLVAFNFDKAIRKILLGYPLRRVVPEPLFSAPDQHLALRNLRVSRACVEAVWVVLPIWPVEKGGSRSKTRGLRQRRGFLREGFETRGLCRFQKNRFGICRLSNRRLIKTGEIILCGRLTIPP